MQLHAVADVFRRNPVRRHAPQATESAIRREGEATELTHRINALWSLDFLLDTLEDGRRVRLLAVVDDFTRACLAIEVDTSIGGRWVIDVLQRLIETRGTPTMLITDNGPEFVSRALDTWAYAHDIRLHFIDQAESECLHRKLQRSIPR